MKTAVSCSTLHAPTQKTVHPQIEAYTRSLRKVILQQITQQRSLSYNQTPYNTTNNPNLQPTTHRQTRSSSRNTISSRLPRKKPIFKHAETSKRTSRPPDPQHTNPPAPSPPRPQPPSENPYRQPQQPTSSLQTRQTINTTHPFKKSETKNPPCSAK